MISQSTRLSVRLQSPRAVLFLRPFLEYTIDVSSESWFGGKVSFLFFSFPFLFYHVLQFMIPPFPSIVDCGSSIRCLSHGRVIPAELSQPSRGSSFGLWYGDWILTNGDFSFFFLCP
ncbi:hypothetical protein P170DRAFT_123092 [Aspergillus steynii IBT 23096]|uniref:Uncharacterized protein n=1 Tax=Aspergillus steynii IBT 23096 TaxID=1392250 RepID=A0A2I2GJM2_9EURO|nr:uncharacterized protein P170DRAFT_123092 [Aspergillus steynii IBT 23096]PLB53083.1 hypothetical protein P170DRAFT_123092 [Aspergillus steynii IBT 23096]